MKQILLFAASFLILEQHYFYGESFSFSNVTPLIIRSQQRQQLQYRRRRSEQQLHLQTKRRINTRGQNGLSWWLNNKRRLSLPLLQLSSSNSGSENDKINNNNNESQQQQHRQQQQDGQINDNRITEFSGLDEIPMVFDSETRDARKEKEEESRIRFVKWGNELWDLRKRMNKLAMRLAKEETKRKNKVMKSKIPSLSSVETRRANSKIAMLKTQLRILEEQDPVLAYKKNMEQYFHQSRIDEDNANKQGGIFLTGTTENQDEEEDDDDDYSISSTSASNKNYVSNDDNDITAEDYHDRAMAARSCLPHFNLEGLWVGRYGDHGYEMINITYIGDLLLAYKVTGEGNVPKNELSFQVDLNPCSMEGSNIFSGGPKKTKLGAPSETPLQPIQLTKEAAEKWGTEQLQRYRGLGQVAEPGFKNSQWMDGQLIIINQDHFSFAWVPLEQQIFFGRPSPSLALRLMREVQEKNEKKTDNDNNNTNDTDLILAYEDEDDNDYDEDDTDSVTYSSWGENTPPSVDDDIVVLKAFVSSCLEKTDQTVKEDLHGDAFSCIWHGMDAEECFFE